MTAYNLGDEVTFADQGGTVAQDTQEAVLVNGTVNGEPISNGDTVYVPVWCERDHGREPTTVYVNAVNIVEHRPKGEGR